MALIRWEPARELQAFQQEVNRLFGTFFDSQTGAAPSGARARRWVPATDLVETEDHYVLRADLPGVAEEDVSIEVEEDLLTISGERKTEHEERRDGYRRVERASGRFSRGLRLPDGVDADAIEASFEGGVLEVRIPKPQEREPRRVSIGVAKSDPVGAANPVGAADPAGAADPVDPVGAAGAANPANPAGAADPAVEVEASD